MNPLQRALVEKAGHDNGFEYVLPANASVVTLGSARHPARASISIDGDNFVLVLGSPANALLSVELARTFPALVSLGQRFVAPDQDALTGLLRRATELAHALPNQAARDFDIILKDELAQLPANIRGTEVEKLVRQRVGQQAFRSAMLDYWGGACAVTGVALPEVLRASHAKPWADCTSDAERLDVFNGFLLSANLDALFDRFLITFNDVGELLVSPGIEPDVQAMLGLNRPQRLRWISAEHLHYLHYHRANFGV